MTARELGALAVHATHQTEFIDELFNDFHRRQPIFHTITGPCVRTSISLSPNIGTHTHTLWWVYYNFHSSHCNAKTTRVICANNAIIVYIFSSCEHSVKKQTRWHNSTTK